MCGIAGILEFSGRLADPAILGRMRDLLAHRGPDGAGMFREGGVGLAHRRLAIIDPVAGIQPFFSHDRRVVLVYNGEVYNYREVREQLAGEYAFRTQSDTEVVLRAYEKWGIDCLDRFRGMFAFALYDGRRGRVYLVRDRLGIKPLYWWRGADHLLFCSELAPLVAAGVPRQIDPAGVGNYFRYQYVPTPGTIYQDVHKLDPGCFLEIDVHAGLVRKQRYWRLRVDIRPRGEGEALEELNAALDETARIYVRSDVPFGAFLSGGVDSSLVTALMANHLTEPVRTFSIGFYERRHSELPYAAEASRILRTNHFEKVVSPELAADVLRLLVRRFGEPFADSSAVPTYYVSREAAGHVKMVLSGDGGDELFAGYYSYAATFRDAARRLPGLHASGMRLLATFGPGRRLRRWAALQALDPVAKHNAQRDLCDTPALSELLALGVEVPPRVVPELDFGDGRVDQVTRFQAQDVATYMLDDILTKVDRMSMAHSLEVRVPLLDHKIVELAFGLPTNLKIRRNGCCGPVRTKYLLRKSAERFFPAGFLSRPKQGFGIPIVEWCRGPLRPLIEDGLRDSRNPIFEWIRFEAMRATLDAFLAGANFLVPRIWAGMMFDLWMKEIHCGLKG